MKGKITFTPPGYPPRSLNSYHLFQREMREREKSSAPIEGGEKNQMIKRSQENAKLWKKMTAQQKLPYKARAQRLAEERKKAIERYKEEMKQREQEGEEEPLPDGFFRATTVTASGLEVPYYYRRKQDGTWECYWSRPYTKCRKKAANR